MFFWGTFYYYRVNKKYITFLQLTWKCNVLSYDALIAKEQYYKYRAKPDSITGRQIKIKCIQYFQDMWYLRGMCVMNVFYIWRVSLIPTTLMLSLAESTPWITGIRFGVKYFQSGIRRGIPVTAFRSNTHRADEVAANPVNPAGTACPCVQYLHIYIHIVHAEWDGPFKNNETNICSAAKRSGPALKHNPGVIPKRVFYCRDSRAFFFVLWTPAHPVTCQRFKWENYAGLCLRQENRDSTTSFLMDD